MRSICFYFQVHQPYRLRTYRFFDIGKDHNYFDDYNNQDIMRRVADKCYIPMNNLLLELIKEFGTAFKVSFSISGTALDQFEQYTPDVLESFKKLAETGCVEFLSETYSHSLSSLKNKNEFFEQVDIHKQKIEKFFGIRPETFRNTELIYSDGIGEMVSEMGFQTMLTEGAKHVLGWKSPNYLYCNSINPKLKLLLKNFRLSDDIAFRFSQQSWDEWPLTTERFVGWLNQVDPAEEVVNLFMDYETFGEHQWAETGIFDFMKHLPRMVFERTNFTFNTPAEVSKSLQPVSAIHVPNPISWADEERDLTAWLGNDLQDEAFDSLYSIYDQVKCCDDWLIKRDWRYLQTSDHFYYMCTKWFSDGDVHKYFNPYGTPYEAFINFMNVLSDFIIRVEKCNKTNESDFSEIKEKVTEITDELGKKLKEKTGKFVGKAKKIVAEKKEKVPDFDEIKNLSNTKIKQVLKNIDVESISIALKGAEKEVIEKILPNLGKRAMKKYDEFEAKAVKFKNSDIKKYRKRIEEEIKVLQKNN